MRKRFKIYSIRLLIIGVCSVFVLFLFSACSGVTGTGANGSATITGTIQTVNASAHSVTVTTNLNGQQQTLTINGLTDAEISALQNQINKTYTFQANLNNNTYSINANATPVEDDNATPQVVETETPEATTTEAAATGSIDFIAKVQNVDANGFTASLPNGDSLRINTNAQTDRGDLNGQLSNGQPVKVEAITNPDGSFTATKLKSVDNEDLQNPTKLNTVDFTGVTTSAVGSDNVVHFKVGSKTYSFATNSTTEIKDFANAQAIGANQSVKVEVLFNGNQGTVTKISNGQ